MDFNWYAAVGLFIASLLFDAVFALYTLAIIKLRPIYAANMALLTYILSAVGIVSYVRNKWYIVPLSVGAFAGSYLVVKYELIKKNRKGK